MTKEEFIKQRCEIDDITEEEFKNTYRVIECVCGEPYCNGYKCLDLDDLVKENQQLKIQISAREEEYKKLEDNWNKLKELIDVKLYNTEYLKKLCGCKIDDVNHLILKIIKNEMQELERGVNK